MDSYFHKFGSRGAKVKFFFWVAEKFENHYRSNKDSMCVSSTNSGMSSYLPFVPPVQHRAKTRSSIFGPI